MEQEPAAGICMWSQSEESLAHAHMYFADSSESQLSRSGTNNSIHRKLIFFYKIPFLQRISCRLCVCFWVTEFFSSSLNSKALHFCSQAHVLIDPITPCSRSLLLSRKLPSLHSARTPPEPPSPPRPHGLDQFPTRAQQHFPLFGGSVLGSSILHRT